MNREATPGSTSSGNLVDDALLARCVSAMNHAIMITDGVSSDYRMQKIIWANRSFYVLTGYEASDVIGQSPLMLQGPSTDPAAMDDLRRAVESGQPCCVEMLSYRKDGSAFWNEAEAIPVEGQGAGNSNWLLVQRDITEQKRQEQITQTSEERYRLAADGANVGIWDWNLVEDEIFFCPVWKRMLGYEDHEIKNEFSEWERLLHPDDFQNALSRVQALLNKEISKYEIEFRLRHKGGRYVDILSQALAVEDDGGGITRLVGIHVDITARKAAEDNLIYQSTHDNLTGLVNRAEFERRTKRVLSSVDGEKPGYALCYLDLDQFKLINDTCGHVAGDELLRQLGGQLKAVIRDSDTLARLGGDEFGILIQCDSTDDACDIASAIQSSIKEFNFAWEGKSFRVSASIGLVPIEGSERTLTELLKDADTACFMAKDLGRDRVQVYREDDMAISERYGEMQWVARIQEAIAEDRFTLYGQAIESLSGEGGLHYELLVRMLERDGRIVPPGAFLPAAERYSLIIQIDKWVLENAIELLSRDPVFLERIDSVSFNISGASLSDTGFLEFVEQLLKANDIDGAKICFEITETAAITHHSMATAFLSALKKMGCKFALDDFGSGLSSYGYLKTLPVDFLKIDGIFVKDIAEDKIDRAMVRSINEIGQAMGIKTIAEFVENSETRSILETLGVDYAQGYGIHKPQPFAEILDLQAQPIQ